MKKQQFTQLALAALLSLGTCLIQAHTEPKFSVLVTLRAPRHLAVNAVANAQYLVINNTTISRILTLVPQPGIIQIPGGSGCSHPFRLDPGQSCLLNLQLIGRFMMSPVHTGPEVCKTISLTDISPDPFLCSQAGVFDHLDVIVDPQ